jgi:aspartate/methionine/tyrosine aminotransferase
MTSQRLQGIQISLIRQINALATPLSMNLGLGEPNVEPDATLRAMAADVATNASWHYSPNPGLLKLRALLAAQYGGGPDPATEICVTAGTTVAHFAVIQALVDPGDEVLIPDPGFVSYPTVPKMAGAIAVPYPLEPPDWTIDVARLESLITPRTKMIIVNSPSNPTGAVASESTLAAIATIAERHDLYVLSDEVYRTVHYGDVPPATMYGKSPKVIVTDGLSKSHSMTGLRLGWIVADRSIMPSIVTAHQYIATCASVFSQELAAAIFEHADWNAEWLASMRGQFSLQRDAALRAVERELHTSITAPGGAFYLFVPVPTCDTETFAKTLATEAAVLAIPGVAFGMKGEGFLRISYAADVETIHRGIARIGAFLTERGR